MYDFKVFLQLFSKLTFGRIVNLIRIYFSFWISAILKKPIISGVPISFAIEPTNSCNLCCKECPTGTGELKRKKGSLNEISFQKILSKIPKETMLLNFNFQGEPFLNEQTTKFITEAVKRNFYTSISTNAHFAGEETAKNIVKSGLNRIIVSLDGTNDETYKLYRSGGDFETVIKNIRFLLNAKKEQKSKTPHIILQFIVLKSNEHQIEEVKKLGKILGVDKVELKTAQIIHFDGIEDSIPSNSKYSRYTKNCSGKFELKKKLKNRCFKMWSSAVICWDGTLVPCCFDKDADFPIGNFIESDFNTLWKNENYNKFRKQILEKRKSIDICCNCNQ